MLLILEQTEALNQGAIAWILARKGQGPEEVEEVRRFTTKTRGKQ